MGYNETSLDTREVVTMKYRTLGRTGIRLSEISFGCWELGGGQWEKESDEINLRAIRQSLELGIDTFDTAEGYGQGHSEDIVGQALEGRRKECVISTKVSRSHLKPEDVRASAEASLKRLRTDYLDIYYIHWPSPDIPLAETLGAFNRLKEDGLVRAIGVSNFSIEQLREAAQYARIDVIQPEYSLLHRSIEAEIVPYCLEHDIGIMSYSSIAKGILTGVYHNGKAQIKETDFRKERRLFLPEHLELERPLIDALRELAEAKGVSMSEVAIGWLLHRPGVTSAIVGTQNERHLAQNAQAAELLLSDAELETLNRISADVLAGIDGK